MADTSWDEILNRSTPDGAVGAIILDMVSLNRRLRELRKFEVKGDYAAVEAKLNELMNEFSKQFNPPRTS